MNSIVRAAITAGTGLTVYAALRLLAVLYKRLSTPLKHLIGPKDKGGFSRGNIPDVDTGRAAEWIEEFGKVMKLKGFFREDFLFTVDTKALNHVLMHPDDFPKAQSARDNLSRTIGPGLLVAEGDQHRLQRRIMNPAFSPMTIRALTSIFHQKASQLCDLMADEVSCDTEAKRFNIIAYLNKATLDIIGLAGFGYHFDALNKLKKENELNKAFSILFSADVSFGFLRVLQATFPIVRFLIPSDRAKRSAQAQATMRRIGIELLNERKIEAKGGHVDQKKTDDEIISALNGRDLLSALVRANTDPNLGESKRLSDEDVLGQVPTFFVAGHETTSTEMTWCLYELSRHPDIQSKLREELIQVPTDTPTMDELNELPYLENVVRETLRFHAAVPKITRVAGNDTVLPLNEPFTDAKGKVHTEIQLKKGDRIFVPIRIMNRLKEIWGEDANEFHPDRWLSTPELARDLPGVWGNMLTFNGGARSCIGYRFALVEMKVLLFNLLRSFEFRLAVPEEDIVTRTVIVTRPYLKDDMKAGSQMPLLVKLCKPAA